MTTSVVKTAVAAVVTTLVGSVLLACGSPARGFEVATKLDWRPCGTGLQDIPVECADLKVPLDWATPDGETISLAIGRQRATGERRGSMVILPGGPGVSGFDILRANGIPWLMPENFRRNFDIVSFDPRGIGASVPTVKCPVDPSSIAQPRSQAEFDALVQQNKTYFAGCRKDTGPLMDHLDSVSTARDIDAIRIALGEPKLTSYGGSYGTMYGATYLETFPDNTRAIVLDGVVDHSLDLSGLALSTARSYEVSFDRFAAWCDANPGCALHGTDVSAVFLGLLSRAPLTAPGAYRGATVEDVREAVRNGLSRGFLPGSEAGWPTLAVLLKQADSGDASNLVGPPDSHIMGIFRGVVCTDFSGPSSWVEMSKAAERARAEAPRFGEFTFWDIAGGCLGWGKAPVDPPHKLKLGSSPNVQVANPFFDPETPLVNAMALVAQIPDSAFMITDADGHLSILRSECAMAAATKFLSDPTSSPRFITCPH
ncbi:MAG: alpha/beta hydrolase [Nocardiaceae bacterium]|nr:alpha/beta hydrolase [Nocardiaceae bacterium]